MELSVHVHHSFKFHNNFCITCMTVVSLYIQIWAIVLVVLLVIFIAAVTFVGET